MRRANYIFYLSYFLLTLQGYCQKLPTIEVHALGYVRYNTPVYVTLDKTLRLPGNYQVQNRLTGSVTNVQVLDDNRLIFMLADTLRPNEVAEYRLIRSHDKPTQSVHITSSETGIQFEINGKPVLFYHTKTQQPPSGYPEYYARSGFIHPVYTPKGKIVTDGFPIGHMHQHGIMMAWVNTTFRKTPVDFWNQHLQTGDVLHREVISIDNGSVVGVIKVRLSHMSKQFGKILDEVWTVTVYPSHTYFLFDLTSEQTNTSEDTLFLNKHHYGGLAFRGAREWSPDDTVSFQNRWSVETDSLYNLLQANGRHAAYVNTSGKIGGQQAGVTVFGFPNNIKYPQAIRVHPIMPYWCYTPVADGQLVFAPGQTITSRFRFYVYDDPGGQLRNNSLLTDLIHPVKALLK